MSEKKEKITRKEFLKKSCAGITGAFAYNLISKDTLDLLEIGGKGIRVLGRTGIKITEIGFGASRIMEPALLRAAIDRSINFIDTGRTYFNGKNEIMVGNTLKGIRKKVVIQSKMRIRLGSSSESKEQSSAIKRAMESSLQTSLKALQTDYIDIMLVHGASKKTDICNETVMKFLEDAKKKGQIRAHGFSCHSELEPLQWANESVFYDVIMLPYNHEGAYVHMNSGRTRKWDQLQVEKLIEKAHQKKIGIIAMKTCSAGPFSPDSKTNSSYPEAMKWVLQHDYVDTMAVAMTNFRQIDENTKAILG